MLCRLTVVLATFAAVSGNNNLRGGSEGVHRFIFDDNPNGEKKSKIEADTFVWTYGGYFG